MTAARFYDSHVHLADARFAGRTEEVLAEFRAVGGSGLLVVAACRGEWEAVSQLAGLPGVWGALGVHPLYRQGWDPDLGPQQLGMALAANSALRAVGEIGLDFQYGRDDQKDQEELFRCQLAMAAAAGYPVLFHNRRSWQEFFAILGELGKTVRGVCHNFTGSRELARQILDCGLFVSFAGPLTYPNARRARETACYVPVDRLLVETDAPDLPPWPRRAADSTPADVVRVLSELATLRGSTVPELAARVATNFVDLFLAPREGQEMPPGA